MKQKSHIFLLALNIQLLASKTWNVLHIPWKTWEKKYFYSVLIVLCCLRTISEVHWISGTLLLAQVHRLHKEEEAELFSHKKIWIMVWGINSWILQKLKKKLSMALSCTHVIQHNSYILFSSQIYVICTRAPHTIPFQVVADSLSSVKDPLSERHTACIWNLKNTYLRTWNFFYQKALVLFLVCSLIFNFLFFFTFSLPNFKAF